MDRPDDDRDRCLLSDVRDDRRGAAPALRVDVPAGRGGRHVLRASVGRDREAVGRADAARLRVRHQGPCADDRPGHRDQAPARRPSADELPEPVATKARIYAKDLPPEVLDEVWATFRDGLEPLAEAGQLGSILLQYPRWFFPSSENRAAIEEAAVRLAGMTCAVEFRNASWLNEKNAERTLGFLEDKGLAFVMVDEPQGFKSSVPPVTAVTSDLALVRFHGRNRETWEAKGITPAERFRYLYSRDELEEWAPRIRRGGERGEGHSCPDEQLLRQLRHDQRPRDRGDPGGRSGGLAASGSGRPREVRARRPVPGRPTPTNSRRSVRRRAERRPGSSRPGAQAGCRHRRRVSSTRQGIVGRIVRLVAVCHRSLLISSRVRVGRLERRQHFAFGETQEAGLVGPDLVEVDVVVAGVEVRADLPRCGPDRGRTRSPRPPGPRSRSRPAARSGPGSAAPGSPRRGWRRSATTRGPSARAFASSSAQQTVTWP